MYKIGKTYYFSAAHTIPGHPKCGKLHGHNYSVTVVLTSPNLKVGMILDYGEMDKVIKPIIEEMDHMYLCPREDMTAAILRGWEVYHLDALYSTAECLAEYLFQKIDKKISVQIEEVTVCETPKTFATYTK